MKSTNPTQPLKLESNQTSKLAHNGNFTIISFELTNRETKRKGQIQGNANPQTSGSESLSIN